MLVRTTLASRGMGCMAAAAAGLALCVFVGAGAPAQTFRRAGVEFAAVRPITVPAGKGYSVVVTQFFHHGLINSEGTNVLVFGKGQKPVPTRVLQLGPGDYCRLAFEVQPGQASYEIFYGGQAPEPSQVPAWTNQDGLLLETRQFQQCNLHNLDSVREAFRSAKPIGADYVEAVQHAYNPFALRPAPFLSRYSGTLRIATAGTYGFLTSSQDCSFLLVDDKLVVDAPGMHRPVHHALRGARKDIQLAAGPHKFEYYHAASGPQAMMVAAWEVNPRDAKPQPAPIPPEVFRTAAIGREPAGPVSLRNEKLVPDFLVHIAGSVPLPDNDVPLVRVAFRDTSPRSLSLNAKITWEFGDGQTSTEANPQHVYLRPGSYTVKLVVRRAGKPFAMANRVYVDAPPQAARDALDTLDDYLPILQTYDPRGLDAAALAQLVAAYQAKADRLLAPPDEADTPRGKPGRKPARPENPQGPPSPEDVQRQHEVQAARRAEAMKYIARAVEAGQAGLAGPAVAGASNEDLLRLARMLGPMARFQLGDSRLAGALWETAAKRLTQPLAQGQCHLEAADIALNDLASLKAGKRLLDEASQKLKDPQAKELAARLQRVWGDYYALAGDGKKARQAYLAADALAAAGRTNVERIAWQGAHGRSAEQFIKSGELDRAAAELHQWQEAFPADKITGYITLLLARYWFGRQQYEAAIALAGQLSAVNPDSPYIDQLGLLAAECELARGNPDQAIARLEALLKNYPGSPLVPAIKERLASLKAKTAKSPR